ncbi:cold-shock protein [Streptomyces sp. NPDC006879]|uniref:cold-shock protein n=1 Tax=Streptomyces sp. NPDC006879 TaxID=3364767 RepID=UPI0036AA7BE8
MSDNASSGMASDDVLSGHVRQWNREEGWGVLITPSLPDEVWAHYSVVAGEGFRELTVGEEVTFTVEQAKQDQFCWRAVRVWPCGTSSASSSDAADSPDTDDSGYSSYLDITFDS